MDFAGRLAVPLLHPRGVYSWGVCTCISICLVYTLVYTIGCCASWFNVHLDL